MTKQVKLWTPDTESILQDCFAQTDWDVFKAAATLEDSSVSIQDYAEYVTGYISTCVDNIVPTIQVKRFPNQKPWINSQVRHMLRARSIAFKLGNETEYKAAKYALEKAIRAAKRQYRVKLDGFYSTADSGRMWQGLQHITDYRTTTSTISSTDSLPDELNTFYTRFETSSPTTERRPSHTRSTLPLSPHQPSHQDRYTESLGTSTLARQPDQITSLGELSEHAPTSRLMFSHPSSTFPSAFAQFPPVSRPQPSSLFQRRAHQAA